MRRSFNRLRDGLTDRRFVFGVRIRQDALDRTLVWDLINPVPSLNLRDAKGRGPLRQTARLEAALRQLVPDVDGPKIVKVSEVLNDPHRLLDRVDPRVRH